MASLSTTDESDDDEFMLVHGRKQLPDTVLLTLPRHLSEKDCLALVLSGASRRFTDLFTTNRKRLVISQCYYLLPEPWGSFFSMINPSLVTVFDCSSCYWIPAKALCSYIVKMENLKELSIHDTKISLEKLPLLFEACQQITKFSFSLAEKNVNQYLNNKMDEKVLDQMKKGFARLTHLTIFTCMAPRLNYWYCVQPWIATLEVLSWCRDCEELFIKIAFYPHIGDYQEDDVVRSGQTFHALTDLKRSLNWMNTLKSLSILKRSSHSRDLEGQSHLIKFFLTLVMLPISKLDSLERLWVDETLFTEEMIVEKGANYLPAPTVKSIILPLRIFLANRHLFLVENERYRNLEHLADVIFSRFDQLINLKYIRGVVFRAVDLDEFCRFHPKLEELIFMTPFQTANVQVFGVGDWKLLLLKVLVYNSQTPSQRILDQLSKACPNIDQFHTSSLVPLGKTETAHFFSSIRFKYLTKLSIRGQMFDGSFLPSMIQQCPKLERLQLTCSGIESDTFFLHLALCLPNAVNLRDLRLEWNVCHGDMSRPLFFLDSLLKNCPRLQRLALILNADDVLLDLNKYAELGDFLLIL